MRKALPNACCFLGFIGTPLMKKKMNTDNPELIIVVDKLLTGFNAPRSAVLYIVRSLKEHSLLQAIARVNRLHTGKNHGGEQYLRVWILASCEIR